MNEPAPARVEWPLAVRHRVDAVCLRFETAWQSGAAPQLETYLGEVDDTARPLLFQELLALELTYRCRSGDTPHLEEYTSRFPEHKELVPPIFAEVVPATADMPPINGHATITGIPVFVGYEILEKLGQGAMGVVYLARQVKPPARPLVALKMMRDGAFATPDEKERFLRETRTMGLLQHPNVVQIYEVSEQDGLPFFAMEYLAGGSLAKQLKVARLTPRHAAEQMEVLARTVQAIHQREVIHRDLKPGNVLLAADGALKITDFGLAKRLDDSMDLTQFGAIVGTLAYMAPEQTTGRGTDISVRTDVHALGAILYELLTGQPPFTGATLKEYLHQITTHEPRFARKTRPRIHRDLQAICLMCLEKEPAQRYASAAALADDLRRFLDGKPILARRITWVGKSLKWVRRHTAAVGLVSLLLGALGGIWGFTAWTAYWSDPQRMRDDVVERLKKDQQVELIGETGPPGYFEWARGKEKTLISTDSDRVFTVSTTKLTLIEFPYPAAANLTRYRFSAQVRHDGRFGGGEVGIYCSRRTHHQVGEPERLSYITLTYKEWNHVKSKKGPAQSRVELIAHYLELRRFGLSKTAVIQPYKPFEAVNPLVDEVPWRELVLEVTPDAVRASWGATPEKTEAFATGTPQQLRKHADAYNKYKKKFKELHDVVFELAPQGGLGLLINQGEASFRRVTLQPLGTPP